ncbi:MAG: putative zinc-binding metallopeptidase [Planctomycetota bacterium]
MKIRDLGLSIHGSPLEPLIENLYQELDAKGIKFHPPCYLADEWLCPDREPIIGIPFFLAHTRLRQIEQKMMYEVEGGTEASCMRFLRHETGHALNYAYKFYSKSRWRQLFGSISSKYSDSYYFQPYSKRFVIHLEDNYAQAHPDEDFAETFAVWLTPDISWQRKYQGWPVINKLRYVDGLIKKISGASPANVSQGKPPWSASRMTSTLAAYYERKRRLLGEEFKGFYDDTLMKLFSRKHSKTPLEKASKILRQCRPELIINITRWTGHRKYDVHQLINKLIYRCDALGLYGQKKDIIGAATLIAAIASNTLRVPKSNRR